MTSPCMAVPADSTDGVEGEGSRAGRRSWAEVRAEIMAGVERCRQEEPVLPLKAPQRPDLLPGHVARRRNLRR